MDTAVKLVEVGVIGAGVAAFCWWQFRDLRIEREKAAARAAAQPEEAAPDEDSQDSQAVGRTT